MSEITLKLISDLSLTPKVHFQPIEQPHQPQKITKQEKHLFIQVSNCSMTLCATYKTVNATFLNLMKFKFLNVKF
jgi:hypothetical protein